MSEKEDIEDIEELRQKVDALQKLIAELVLQIPLNLYAERQNPFTLYK
jgi:hypothetical protein